ncbi:MAG: PSD1 and planctomycete cytochrome C domain-containing protein [Pirellulaceae bacterium]|nr:PSD1 and planctomycete cytochrome C domain-containing protein [Pirellulaceae bacterium]
MTHQFRLIYILSVAVWFGFGLTANTAEQESADSVATESRQWVLSNDLARFDKEFPNPLPDSQGHTVWFFLRTTGYEGPMPTRQWLRDGKYVPLGASHPQLFNVAISGWIYQAAPFLSPMFGRVLEPMDTGVSWNPGDINLSPGPDHAVIVGWQSPVFGRMELEGKFEHAQDCCGINSQIDWYVQRGPAPRSNSGFIPTELLSGHSNYGTEDSAGTFHLVDLEVNAGDFVYFIVDAHADGTDVPHTGDGTRFDVTVTVHDAKLPPPPSFEKDIRPILATACFDCHGEDMQEAQLDVRTVSSILQGGENGHGIVQGNPDRSLLLDMLERNQMPPEGMDPLSNTQISLIRRWIAAGAPADEKIVKLPPRTSISDEDRQYWAFQSPVKARLPDVQTNGQTHSALDRLILNRLENKNLTFSPQADRLTLLRRAWLNLIGLPPTPAELKRFENDTRPDAWERLLDRLLANPHYGERWGRHWLDAVAYVDNRLFDGDLRTIYANEEIWRYRDYVLNALNEDLPYDMFLTEQLAGDELVDWRTKKEFTPDIVRRLEATGFYRSIEDHTSQSQYGIAKRYEVVFDTMQMLTSGVMGLTLECCRCHNHKFDPLPQRDYYRLMAIVEPALNPHNWRTPQQRWLPDVSPAKREEIDAHNSSIDQQVKPLQNQQKKAEEQKNKTEAENLKAKISKLQQGKRSYRKIQALWDVGPAPRSRLLRRGNVATPGVFVEPGFPEVLSMGRSVAALKPQDTAGESTGMRLALARWLTQPDHPLTARVMVNRVWHHHFGKGIVETPGNFGRSGSPPTHPELLDWLAVDFAERDWSLKRLHQRIMTSAVYQQTSSDTAQTLAHEIDPLNEMLWRMPMRRLESESIRDSLLSVAGTLDRSPGGPPVMISNPASGLSRVKQEPTPTSNLRRSIYLFARRVYPLSFLEVFDSPIVAVNCTRRMSSATVLQSVTQLNDTFVLENATNVARRIQQMIHEDTERQIVEAWRIVLTREPEPETLARCQNFLAAQQDLYEQENAEKQEATAQALTDLCHMLLCTNEFLYVE